ncbi:acyltransferase [Sphingobacterium mizutaii]|uniref:acyltransferase n=1 Tax=Sphingobacterium mizutaii TaxID=1010 RepID=UPI00289AC89B|nr:acyltransferase [Sphingobacterium mizutaii]
MILKRLLKRIYLEYLIKKSPIKYAKYIGVKVGEKTRFMGPKHGMFGSEPFLISIGKNCLITGEVRFVTHDGSVYHLKEKHPKADLFGRIKIGDNVFIGLRTIILPGVEIGDNVVIGAGSVVTRSIPSNTVAVGSPAKPVSTLQDYLEKIETKIMHTGGLPMDEKKKILESELK